MTIRQPGTGTKPWAVRILAASFVAALIPWPTGASEADTTSFVELGRMGVFPAPTQKEAKPGECYENHPEGHVYRNEGMILAPRLGSMHQFFDVQCGPGRGVVYKSISLKNGSPQRSALIPITELFGSSSGGPSRTGEWLWSRDEDRDLIYIAWQRNILVIDERAAVSGGPPLRDAFQLMGTLTASEGTARAVNLPECYQRCTIMGMSFARPPPTRAPRLLVYLMEEYQSRFTAPLLVQLDPDSGKIDWRLRLDACDHTNQSGNNRTRVPVFRSDRGSRRFVYTVCNVRSGLATVVRVPLTGPPDAEVPGQPEAFGGPSHMTEAWGDPVAERMILVSSKPAGKLVWVFDGLADRYVGTAGLALEPNVWVAYGFDRDTGRLYALVPDHLTGQQAAGDQVPVQGGLRILDTRQNPLPQPVNFPSLAWPGETAILIAPPRSNSSYKRILVRRGSGIWPDSTPQDQRERDGIDPIADPMWKFPDGNIVWLEDEPFYRVLEDRNPYPVAGLLSDLDRLTAAVAERPGVTSASFEASASAYGARVHLVGGLAAAARGLPGFEAAEEALAISNTDSRCLYNDRDVMLGWSERARLSEFEASARAAGLAVDPLTRADLGATGARCAPSHSLLTGLPWGAADGSIGGATGWKGRLRSVECVGDGSPPPVAEEVSEVRSEVACAHSAGTVSSSSTASVALGPIRVAHANSAVRLTRRAGIPGVTVESDAWASGVAIADQVTIALIHARATSSSAGVPGSNKATLLREICGVRSPSFERERCLTPEEQVQFITETNRILGPMGGKMFAPEPDPEYLKGTPGGYLAGVTKKLADALDDQILSRDLLFDVPALTIEFQRDSARAGNGKQIFQFAAVRGVATYGVQCEAPYEFVPAAGDCVEAVLGAGAIPTEVKDLVLSREVPPPAGEAAVEKRRQVPSVPERIVRTVGGWLVRSMSEGLLGSAVWMTLGIPFVLVGRRRSLARGKAGS